MASVDTTPSAPPDTIEDTLHEVPGYRRPSLARRMRRNPRLYVSGAMLALAVLVAIFAPLLTPYDPNQIGVGPALEQPTLDFPLGVDPYGRDQLSRILVGTRISVGVAALVAAASIAVGLPLGLVVGYVGGRFDFVVGRVFDVLFAFPSLLLALVLSTLLKPGLRTVTLALVIVYIPVVTRFIRSAAISERTHEYVLATQISGASTARVLVRHILPNIVSPLLVLASLIMAFSVLAEAALSYIGFGSQPPNSSWGKMLTEHSDYIETAPHLAIYPGLAITYVVLALNLFGDSLRDRLDPRLRSRAERLAR
jgi:peptide/nickel transport system permease protein